MQSQEGGGNQPLVNLSVERFADPVYVTKAFMPPFDEYMALMRGVWERGYITNNGPLLQAFEKALDERFGLPNSLFMVNGTIALHMAIRALELKGEVLTTAFSHPVTSTSVMWEGCTPVFVDVDPLTFCMDPARIEERITPRTSAIMATHVYGLPCDLAAIKAIADRHGLKVIYDGAHAFGTRVGGKSVLAYGDISTTSYHATKIFHTVEGGSLHTNDPELYKRLRLLRTMGQVNEDFHVPGLNAKNSEMHAAMGMANLPYFDEIMAQREHQWWRYHELLSGTSVRLAKVPEGIEYNHAYFPAVFGSEAELLRVRDLLNSFNVFPRRYFRPASTTLPFIGKRGECPVAEGLADRVLCLPLYHGLEDATIERIALVIKHGSMLTD